MPSRAGFAAGAPGPDRWASAGDWAGFLDDSGIDLTLLDGTLHCTAVYRHRYLIAKAYGNLVGVSDLMHFLCEQTGAECGELVVHATLADARSGQGPKLRALLESMGGLL